MKKIFFIITILLSISLFSTISADGFIHIYDDDMWSLLDEEQQFCAINYKEGYQNMILTVDMSDELKGEKAVWIFPIPASPNKTAINIVKGFPQLLGYDVEDRASDSISEVFATIRVTQIYTFPLFLMSKIYYLSGDLSDGFGQVDIYESIEKMGLTTELVSAADGSSLTNYIASKGLTLPAASKSMLDDYAGQEYSFVITWISDIEKFKQEKGEEEERDFRGRWTGNSIGVFITFPTDKIYYPLKPTSLYGDKRVPAVIYVLDYVKPELYDGIKADTEINYFFESHLRAPEELRDFFTGYEKKSSTYYAMREEKPGFIVRDVKYTKIKINPPSKYLTQDLWMEVSTPLKVKTANFANRFGWAYGLTFFIICSCLASLFSGMIIFRGKQISKIKFALFGLWNFLTLFGLSTSAYISRIDLRFTQARETQKSDTSFIKIFKRTLLIALIIPILLILILTEFFSYFDSDIVIPMLILYAISAVFVSPLVWGYYKNRKIMKFTILFTIFFIILTVISQLFLFLIV